MDMSVTQTLRVVHRRTSRRGAQGRHQCTGDTHLHHTVLPQVRSQNYHAVHLREPLPATVKDVNVHRIEGGEPLRKARHVLLPQVCSEET